MNIPIKEERTQRWCYKDTFRVDDVVYVKNLKKVVDPNNKGEIIDYLITYKRLDVYDDNGELVEFDYETVSWLELEKKINDVLMTLTNTEFFTMYINWNNFVTRKDYEYADRVHYQITNNLNWNNIEKIGRGAFEPYDYLLYEKFKNYKKEDRL